MYESFYKLNFLKTLKQTGLLTERTLYPIFNGRKTYEKQVCGLFRPRKISRKRAAPPLL